MKGTSGSKEFQVGTSLTAVTYVVHEFASDCSEALIDRVTRRLVPEDDRVLLKRLNKIEARKKKQKEEQSKKEDADEEEEEQVTQPRTVLTDSDDGDDMEEEDVKDPRKRLPKTWIHDNEDSIVDFLDPAAAQKVSATNPRSQAQSASAVEKRKRKESMIKIAPDGRMIIDDDGDSDGDISNALGKMKVGQKHKFNDNSSITKEDEPSFKYQAGGSGIHRPVARSVAGSVRSGTGSVRKLTTKQRIQESKEKSKPSTEDFGSENRSSKTQNESRIRSATFRSQQAEEGQTGRLV